MSVHERCLGRAAHRQSRPEAARGNKSRDSNRAVQGWGGATQRQKSRLEAVVCWGQDWERLATARKRRKNRNFHLPVGDGRMAKSNAAIVNSKRASRSTYNVLGGEDEDLSSEDDPVEYCFHHIF
jgi:hypothetical protein